MSRLKKLFENKNAPVLNVYCTAGYPTLNATTEVIAALEEHGADMIEIGIPYSDPLADGEVIQKSSSIALANGMNIVCLFDQLKNIRQTCHLPLVLMGYMNPVLQYGFEKFCAAAAAIGIDGLILPDLPMFEFETVYGPILKKYELDFIFLVTPETAETRVRQLDELSSGFLYAVSASATTGSTNNQPDLQPYLQRLANYQLMNPILVGFGIKDKASFKAACQFSKGAIIGSAYIKALENTSNINESTKEFIKQVLN
ncbi:MAG: tryptophan synthase subunit alpha [Chitinophagaceae bacterium]